ncbi:MAG: hypothetical protein SOV20_08905 [Coriobacteriales bacterium]|nr:hypothetical protein [Coriobacteriaceae bacterium]MDY2723917.1 hypothetical protein [Coriobacteriales bacterium]
MGLFKHKKKEDKSGYVPPVQEDVYGEEVMVDGFLRIEKFRPQDDGTYYKSLVEPPDIVEARKTLKRIKDTKLAHSKSERKNIEDLVAAGESCGIGELVREESTSGPCHYRAMYKGKDVGLLPSSSVGKIKQCYGLYRDDEYPEHVACKIVLRVYEEGGGWSAASIL